MGRNTSYLHRVVPSQRAVPRWLLVLLLLGVFASSFLPARAQAGQAGVTINLSFVDQAAQPASPPSGTAANVQFTFTPVTAGLSPSTLVTFSTGQLGKSEAVGSLATGTYAFQEVVPTGAVFENATISQSGGQTLPLTNGGQVSVAPGGAYTIAVTDLASTQSTSSSGTATLTLFKTLVGASGQPTSGALSGFSFTLAGQNGLPSQTQVTDAAGQAVFANVAPGVYSLTEAPSSGTSFGSMTINGVTAQQGQLFQVQAGGTYDVNVTNSVSGSGNVTVQVQAVDQNGQPVGSASLSGYSFTITPQNTTTGAASTVVTTTSGQAVTNLPPGSYTITESPLSGATLVGYTINNVPTQTGVFTVGASQTTMIVATNRVTATATGTTGTTGATRTVNLQAGCNNVSNTYPDASPSQTIASGIVPSASIDSIWRFDNSAQKFSAAYFAPVAGSNVQPPTDIQTLNHLDAIFICVTTPATFTEPSA